MDPSSSGLNLPSNPNMPSGGALPADGKINPKDLITQNALKTLRQAVDDLTASKYSGVLLDRIQSSITKIEKGEINGEQAALEMDNVEETIYDPIKFSLPSGSLRKIFNRFFNDMYCIEISANPRKQRPFDVL
jgi:hypothetical protein